MKVAAVHPPPNSGKVPFRQDQYAHVPEGSGCYVLTAFDETVLYFGQAVNIRRRFENHLDTDRMTAATEQGTAFWFHWRLEDDIKLNALERGWLEAHIVFEGDLPPLNRANGAV